MAPPSRSLGADVSRHMDTYDGVCTLIKVSIALIVVTLLLMAMFLV